MSSKQNVQRFFVIPGNEKNNYTDTLVPYLPREHTGTKFIYIVRPNNEEILVIGDKRANLHVKLWDCYEESHRDSKESEILGAGELENGRIINWFSKWFHLTTPEELRPHIQKLLELPQST